MRKLVLAGLALFGLCWYGVDSWVARKVPLIESSLSQAIHRPVRVQRAHFDPFRGFLIDGVRFWYGTPLVEVQIQRIQAVPDFQLFPVPAIRIRKLILNEPLMALGIKPEQFFQSGIILKNLSPKIKTHGFFNIRVDLSHFEIRKAKIDLESAEKKKDWKQRLENVNFIARYGWFGSSFVELKGNVLGGSRESFLVRCETQRDISSGIHSNLKLDFKNFNTAHLNRYFGGRLKLPQMDAITVSANLSIRKNHRFQAKGRTAFANAKFLIRGDWDQKGITFESISLKGGAAEMKGDGRIDWAEPAGSCRIQVTSDKIPVEKLKGLIPRIDPREGFVKIVAAVKGSLLNLEPSVSVSFFDCGFQDQVRKVIVTHLNGSMGYAGGELRVRELWAFANNIPVRMNGYWSTKKRNHFLFEASTNPGRLPGLCPDKLVNFSVKAIGVELKGGWVGSLRAVEEQLFKGKKEKNSWFLQMRGLRRQEDHWVCRSAYINRSPLTPGSARSIFEVNLKSLLMFFHFNKRYAQLLIREGSLGAGGAALRLRAYYGAPLYEAYGKFKGIMAQEFMSRIKMNIPLSGKMEGSVYWIMNRGEPRARIRFHVTDGNIRAGSLGGPQKRMGIESLRNMNFLSFLGQIHYAKGIWKMRKFHLKSKECRISADLQVGKKNISGLLSASFLAGSIPDTSDLKKLLRFAGAQKWVDLDFKVSGLIHSPRVQWLGGEFKQKVQARLAPWMKQEVSRQVEKYVADGVSAGAVSTF